MVKKEAVYTRVMRNFSERMRVCDLVCKRFGVPEK